MFRTLPSINELVSVMQGNASGSSVELGTATASSISLACNFTNCEIYNRPAALTTVPTQIERVVPELVHMESNKNQSVCCYVKSCHEDSLSNVKVTLENEALWKKFHSEGNEMMVTKPGRRMFPVLGFKISGLLPFDLYKVAVDFVFVDKFRYRFFPSQNVWRRHSPDLTEPTASCSRCKEHRKSPANGQSWTSETLSFEHLRLTNHLTTEENLVYLPTMRKYQINVVVTKLLCALCQGSHTRHIDIPMTEFVAVTTYQNAVTVQLKIDNNPLAKVFRENSKKRVNTSHKRQESNTEVNRKRKINDNSEMPLETLNYQVQSSTSTDGVSSSTTSRRPTSSVNLNSALFSVDQPDGIACPRLHHFPCLCQPDVLLNDGASNYISHDRSLSCFSSPRVPATCPRPEISIEYSTMGYSGGKYPGIPRQ